MSSDGGAKRWWEDYLVRYFMPSIAGVVIVIWLGDIAGDNFQELLLLPKTTYDINTPNLILLFLYGNLVCYVASYPILSFHATRVWDCKNLTWRSFFLSGYVATAVVSLAVLYTSLSLPTWCRNWWAFLLAIAFSFYQIVRICMVMKSNKDISRVYTYASTLAKRRSLQKETATEALTRGFFNDKGRSMQWRRDLIETYRHLREHGNSGFIFVLELTLAGLTYCIVANDDLLDPLKKLSAVGILFAFWAFPAALVHMLAQHLERSLAEDDR